MQHVAHVYMSGHVHVQTHNIMYTTCNVLCMYYTHMHFFPKNTWMMCTVYGPLDNAIYGHRGVAGMTVHVLLI